MLILAELEELSNVGVRFPYFTDEDMVGGYYDRCRTIAEEIIELKNKKVLAADMNFYFSMRVNDVVTKDGIDALKLWRKAGLREVFIGLESGIKSQLNRYGKAATPCLNLKAIDILKEMELQIDIGFILFDPEMTFEELKLNSSFIEKMKLNQYDARSIKQLRVQPETMLCKRYAQNDLLESSLDVNNLIYSAKYLDDRVLTVMKEYQKWENEVISQVYSIQAKTRGEVTDERVRLSLKSALSQLRDLDFAMLKLLIAKTSRELTQTDFLIKECNLRDKRIGILDNSRACWDK